MKNKIFLSTIAFVFIYGISFLRCANTEVSIQKNEVFDLSGDWYFYNNFKNDTSANWNEAFFTNEKFIFYSLDFGFVYRTFTQKNDTLILKSYDKKQLYGKRIIKFKNENEFTLTFLNSNFPVYRFFRFEHKGIRISDVVNKQGKNFIKSFYNSDYLTRLFEDEFTKGKISKEELDEIRKMYKEIKIELKEKHNIN